MAQRILAGTGVASTNPRAPAGFVELLPTRSHGVGRGAFCAKPVRFLVCVAQSPYVRGIMIYLDNNATTPVDPRVLGRMIRHLGPDFGNSSSAHSAGRAAARAIDEARGRVAALVGVRDSSITWTSGATEALNTILKGLAVGATRRRIVYCATEHKAVLDTVESLVGNGNLAVAQIPVDRSGLPEMASLDGLLDDETLAVCVMAGNNETGVLAELGQISDRAHEAGAQVVCDATQVAGKLPIDLVKAGVDYAAISAHKMYGPQGVGAVIAQPVSPPLSLPPLIHGGGHQGGRRSGTLNLAGIAGFGVAAEIALEEMEREAERVARLRDRLEQLLEKEAGPLTIHSVEVPRLPNTTNVRLHGVDADALIVNCPDVAFSSGSACTSSVPTPSHVLTAMGIPAHEAEESIRFSLGRFTTEQEVDQAAELIGAAAARIREVNS